ncbi:MAG: PQQ-dependent sugar dehydrogenase [Pseudomonadota bacterium]|nr:PQQ-dependent sugar dehydrogenase [Pseudomonadota bacterium]
MRLITLLAIIFYSSSFGYCNSQILTGTKGTELKARVVADFFSPWSMTFLNSDLLLVTSKKGNLWLVSKFGEKREVSGVPEVAFGGQGGLGDIVLHPQFSSNNLVFLSFVRSEGIFQAKTAVVVRATLQISKQPKLTDIEKIWEQTPKAIGSKHFSHRLVFGPQGSDQEGKLFITSGDRGSPVDAQDWNKNLGKIIRLNVDGSIPNDNPFQNRGELARTFWTLGHRNPLGIAFDTTGRLWSNEMGPRHGDELNLIIPGKNYGWPIVSEGDHYSGKKIPAHHTRPEFTAPALFWVPTVAPSGLLFYSGQHFLDWKDNLLFGGLKSKALVRVEIIGENAIEVERFNWGSRIREVEQAPDGSIWVLEDPPNGRLIQLTKP